ncbi:NADH-quinone oxidoreductase subunit N [Streptomyces bomunensis]|uniref:NADH-quinone oxidoreductase subunit N n=2 Tax=Streptomyces montanisoli TaxID=2798581 RepID=A0A940M7X9_9ACTN|nr:NADH-quinone oxidoreductase subunit N [Streptomyces montanisoli]
MALVVLVADLFVEERRKPLLGAVSVTGLVLALLSLLPLRSGDRATFCVGGGHHLCSYTADHFALVIQLLVLGGALLTALLSMAGGADGGAGGGPAGEADRFPGEYWFLLLSSASGAALLPAARDLATLVVALEVASLPAFALVGIRRGDRLSAEAALKFFLSSVAATAIMLLGVSFVYAATGSLHLSAVATGLTHVPGQLQAVAAAGVLLTLVGFAFKTAAAPFHFWVPDTYVGAPLPIAAYLSVVSKAVGFSGLILVTVVAFPPYAHLWGPALAVLAALTMSVGNAAALRQSATRARGAVRLLAWSSVAQAGYLLVPIAAAAYAGEKRVGSTVAYALMYAAVNLGAFGVAALVARARPFNRLDDYRGLYARRPLTALALAFFLLCLAGLPPGIIGLFAKVTVFSSAVDAGLGWLAVLMAANVVCALYYYLRWTALLFRAPGASAPGGSEPGASEPGASAPDAPAVATPEAAPRPLVAAVALAAVVGLALSGAPQLVLRFTDTNLF